MRIAVIIVFAAAAAASPSSTAKPKACGCDSFTRQDDKMASCVILPGPKISPSHTSAAYWTAPRPPPSGEAPKYHAMCVNEADNTQYYICGGNFAKPNCNVCPQSQIKVYGSPEATKGDPGSFPQCKGTGVCVVDVPWAGWYIGPTYQVCGNGNNCAPAGKKVERCW